MACQIPDRPDQGVRYRSLSNFYLADPRRLASQERDLGLWWRMGVRGPTYRAAWVHETGELYAARLGMPKQQCDVHVLGRGSAEELDEAIAGWADICPQPDSMTWLRHRAMSLAQIETPPALSHEQRELAFAEPRPQQTKAALIDRDQRQRATRRIAVGVGVENEVAARPRRKPAAARAERESRAWIERLRATGPERDGALVELHALLLRAARFEISRRAGRANCAAGTTTTSPSRAQTTRSS